MPIVSGNEPDKGDGGRGIWWLLPVLLVASGPLASLLQQSTGWNISRWQVLFGGVIVLAAVWLLWPNSRGGRGNASPGAPMPGALPTRLPTSLAPPRPPAPPSMPSAMQLGRQQQLPAPRFEPYVTGKVLLIGLVLLIVFGGIGLFVVVSGL